MSKELKRDLILAVFVGVACAVMMGVYQALNVSGLVQNPLYWASYLPVPAMFMVGGTMKDAPFNMINILFGVACAWACNWFAGVLGAGVGFPAGMTISMGVFNFIVMAVAGGLLAKSIGRCPIAVVGFIAFFAAGGENLVVLCVSLLCGILCGTVMVKSGEYAARLAGIEESLD